MEPKVLCMTHDYYNELNLLIIKAEIKYRGVYVRA